MLPLSGSLYITGQLESIENVLVDIGTGYFCEVRNRGHTNRLPLMCWHITL